MTPTFSVTFTIGEDDFSVPFESDVVAAGYASTVVERWPEAVNVVVNDLVS